MVEDRDAVAQLFGLLEVVRRHDDGPALGLDPLDDVPQVPARLGIEAPVGSSRNTISGSGKSAGQRESLGLAARELLHLLVGSILEADREPVRRRPGSAARRRGRRTVVAARAPSGARRTRSSAAGRPCAAADRDCAARTGYRERAPSSIGLAQAFHDLDGRRLAGAVGPEQAEDLSRLDRERDVVDGDELSVALPQALGNDRGGHRPLPIRDELQPGLT